MDTANIDSIISNLGKDVLNMLLSDHSDKSHDSHIYWATDNYLHLDRHFFDPIQIEDITSNIRRRSAKSKEEQGKRTRDKGEVYTPAWICDAQNNLVDNAWKKSATSAGKTWQDYVCSACIEISCGEAPYLASRYDVTTGQEIELKDRIGLFDRKMRIVNENACTLNEWYLWALAALKSTYGYEWQGDNLFLARTSILLTFIDFYNEFVTVNRLECGKPSHSVLLLAAKIISWNIFQMDGIKMTLPMKDTHKQVVAHWNRQSFANDEEPVEITEFDKLISQNDDRLKFDIVVGNPPYQQMDGGAGASAVPIYNTFVDIAKQVSQSYVSLIIPSRWMTGGRGLDKFRASMLNDTHIAQLFDHYNASDCFSNVEIKGGVCYFLWDKNHNNKCEIHTYSINNIQHSTRYLKEDDGNIFIRDSELINIKRQIEKKGEKSFESIVSSMKPYGLRGDFFKNPAKYGYPPISTTKQEGDITIIGLDEKLHRTRRYVSKSYPLIQNDLTDKIKLFVPRNYGTGKMGDLPSKIECAMPYDICTETFVQIGPFQTVEEAQNCEAYMRTKLFAVLVGIRKQDQGAGKSVYRYVPLQDFSVRWTDDMLITKYQLSDKQVEYINQILNI